jgi:hypothetical protein
MCVQKNCHWNRGQAWKKRLRPMERRGFIMTGRGGGRLAAKPMKGGGGVRGQPSLSIKQARLSPRPNKNGRATGLRLISVPLHPPPPLLPSTPKSRSISFSLPSFLLSLFEYVAAQIPSSFLPSFFPCLSSCRLPSSSFSSSSAIV